MAYYAGLNLVKSGISLHHLSIRNIPIIKWKTFIFSNLTVSLHFVIHNRKCNNHSFKPNLVLLNIASLLWQLSSFSRRITIYSSTIYDQRHLNIFTIVNKGNKTKTIHRRAPGFSQRVVNGWKNCNSVRLCRSFSPPAPLVARTATRILAVTIVSLNKILKFPISCIVFREKWSIIWKEDGNTRRQRIEKTGNFVTIQGTFPSGTVSTGHHLHSRTLSHTFSTRSQSKQHMSCGCQTRWRSIVLTGYPAVSDLFASRSFL